MMGYCNCAVREPYLSVMILVCAKCGMPIRDEGEYNPPGVRSAGHMAEEA